MMEAQMVHSRWPRKRVFRAGFLQGRGLSSDEIAKDPEVQSHPSVVRRYASQMGHPLEGMPAGNLVLDLPRKALRVFEGEASKRKRSPEALVSRLLIILADEPHLFANIMEDDV